MKKAVENTMDIMAQLKAYKASQKEDKYVQTDDQRRSSSIVI